MGEASVLCEKFDYLFLWSKHQELELKREVTRDFLFKTFHIYYYLFYLELVTHSEVLRYLNLVCFHSLRTASTHSAAGPF